VPPNEDIYLFSNGAEIKATESMSRLFDIRNIRYAHLEGLFINGNGLAEKCVDGVLDPSGCPMHVIKHCKVWGATKVGVDFTGCEDSTLIDVWIDGRKDTKAGKLTCGTARLVFVKRLTFTLKTLQT